MDDKPKIDLKQHVIKRVSRKYILKIILYIVLLTAIIIYYFNHSGDKVEKKEAKDVKQINNVTIAE